MGKFGPRRTILDVPGNSAHKLRRGLDSAADALMVDLEDSVPIDDVLKKEARHTVAEALTGAERDILIRTNEVVSPWFADDAALAVSLNVSGIILPKSTSIEQIVAAQRDLGISASVYTQTTDVEGEVNGLLTYDRRVEKIPAAELAKRHAQVK